MLVEHFASGATSLPLFPEATVNIAYTVPAKDGREESDGSYYFSANLWALMKRCAQMCVARINRGRLQPTTWLANDTERDEFSQWVALGAPAFPDLKIVSSIV